MRIARENILRIYLAALIAEGFLAFGQILSIGISIVRILMAALALSVVGILSFVLWVTWKDEKRSKGLAHFFDRLCSGRTYNILVVALIVLGVIGVNFFLPMHKMTDMQLRAYFVRLAPFVLCLTLTSFQTPLFLHIWKLGFQFPCAAERSAIIATGITLLVTLFAAWLIMVTRVKLTRDNFVGLG